MVRCSQHLIRRLNSMISTRTTCSSPWQHAPSIQPLSHLNALPIASVSPTSALQKLFSQEISSIKIGEPSNWSVWQLGSLPYARRSDLISNPERIPAPDKYTVILRSYKDEMRVNIGLAIIQRPVTDNYTVVLRSYEYKDELQINILSSCDNTKTTTDKYTVVLRSHKAQLRINILSSCDHTKTIYG